MSIVYHNGEWLDSTIPQLLLSERFIRVGDSYFETILVESSVALWLEKHYERVCHSAEVLQMTSNISFQEFRKIVYSLITRNQLKTARARIIFYRKGEGAYLSDSNKVGIIATIESFEKSVENEIQLSVFDSIKKPINLLSNLKSSNALLYILAAKFANDNRFSDCLILNENGNVCETSNATVFIISNAEIITPPLNEGCVAGVGRAVLLDIFDVVERTITLAELLEAESVFITNALKGIVPVKSCMGMEFPKSDIFALQENFERKKQQYIEQQLRDYIV